eukprot:1688531-Amphidinium_carterae.2
MLQSEDACEVEEFYPTRQQATDVISKDTSTHALIGPDLEVGSAHIHIFVSAGGTPAQIKNLLELRADPRRAECRCVDQVV